MCGRYNFTAEQVEEIARMVQEINKRLSGNTVRTGEVRPTDLAAVVTPQGPAAMSWGFPHFKGSGVIINAKSETVTEKRMFRDSAVSRRCLIPSTGFYEWGTAEDHQLSLFEPAPSAKTGKTKYLFNLPDMDVLYMAGFWKRFQGEEAPRFVILTTAANSSIGDIHNRMPVVLRREEWPMWLENADFGKLFDRRDILLERKAV